MKRLPIAFLAILAVLVAASPVMAAAGKEMAFLRRGLEYFEAKDYQRAVRAFTQAVRHNPDCTDAQEGLGLAYMQLGTSEAASNVEMVDNAIAAFKEVLRLAPRSAEARYQLGLAHLIVNDKKSAMKEYEALKVLDPGRAEQLQLKIAAYKAPKSLKTLVSTEKDGKSTRISVAGNQVLVPVSFTHNGKIVEASLLLDTGASSTLISREMARRLDINVDKATPVKFQVVGGGMVQGWHTKVDRVEVGPHAKAGMEVAVVAESGPFPFDGLLGMNFLRSFKYSIDFSNQVIYWAR